MAIRTTGPHIDPQRPAAGKSTGAAGLSLGDHAAIDAVHVEGCDPGHLVTFQGSSKGRGKDMRPACIPQTSAPRERNRRVLEALRVSDLQCRILAESRPSASGVQNVIADIQRGSERAG